MASSIFRRYDLTGTMNQSVNPFLVQDKDFTYLLNVNQDEFGTIQKDGGYSKYGSTEVGAGYIEGGIDYVTTAGVHTPVRICNGSLQSASGTTWSDIDAGEFTAGKTPSFANFLDRVYIATDDKNVRYSSGGACTTIDADNGGANVRGKYLALNEQVLYLANLTTVYSGNEIVYSKVGTHQFYNDGETYATTRRKIRIDGEITGIRIFQGLVMIFTNEALWYHNPSTLETKVFYNHGTTSNDSIREIYGNLIWADRDGIHMFTGSGNPENISRTINNPTIPSVWSSINGVNWTQLKSEVVGDKYYLYIGDLTQALPGDSVALNDIVIVYDNAKQSFTILDEYPVSCMFKIITSGGDQKLLFGSKDTRTTYVKDFSYTHDTSAFNSIIRTKYYDMGTPEFGKMFGRMYVTYRPQNQTGKYLTLKVALDGSNSYIAKVGSATDTRMELSGLTTISHVFKRVSTGSTNAKSISYEFSQADAGVNYALLGIAQEFTEGRFTSNVSV